MFSDSLNYLFKAFGKKELFLLLSVDNTYDPITGGSIETEISTSVSLIELSIDVSNLPKGCLSTDRKFMILTDNIDKTDKLEDTTGKKYIIINLKHASFSPSIYEVIVRVY